MNMPVTSVDLGYKTSTAQVSNQMGVWLPNLGHTAAETIMRQIENIENEGSSQQLHIHALPPAYVDLQSMEGGFSAPESA
jgi:hypothetical protein